MLPLLNAVADIGFQPLDALTGFQPCRFHLSMKLLKGRITVHPLDVGINLRLLRPPCGINGILAVKASYAPTDGLGRHAFA